MDLFVCKIIVLFLLFTSKWFPIIYSTHVLVASPEEIKIHVNILFVTIEI